MSVSIWECVLMFFGVLLTYDVIKHLYNCIRYSALCHFVRWFYRTDLKSVYGPWAVVTGASGGIGLGLVEILAENGFNIVLISRNYNKLQQIAYDIERDYGVATKIIAKDASDRSTVEDILTQLSQLDLGILVNNVGIIAEDGVRPLPFHETRYNRVYEMNSVNCGYAALLMHGVLPQMISRRRGLIINMSSIAVYTPIPYQAQYSATKMFLDMLTESVKGEVDVIGSGVTIKSVRPFIVKSNMTSTNNYSYNSPMAQTPRQFAQHLFPTLSHDLTTCGYWLADFVIWSFRVFPDWYKTGFAHIVLCTAIKKGIVVQLDKQ